MTRSQPRKPTAPRHAATEGLHATPGTAPAPLGAAPSEEQHLDVALEYTFPASDPIAIDCAPRGRSGARAAGGSRR